jgi:hypothetical protein
LRTGYGKCATGTDRNRIANQLIFVNPRPQRMRHCRARGHASLRLLRFKQTSTGSPALKHSLLFVLPLHRSNRSNQPKSIKF